MTEGKNFKRDRSQLDCDSTEVSSEHKRPTTMALTLKDLETLRKQISGDMNIKLQPLVNQVQEINQSVKILES